MTETSSDDSSDDKPSAPGSPSSSPKTTAGLPDLTKRLVKAGIYDDYLKYRDNYRQWRKGGSQGARGEVSDVGKVSDPRNGDPYKFEMWFPTPQKFHFFFTASYWTAIFTLEGCLFFTFGSVLPYLSPGSKAAITLTNWSNLIGALFFTAATYGGYLQLINLQDAQRVYLCPSYERWTVVLQQVRVDTLTGTLIYLVASLVYNVMVSVAVLPGLGCAEYIPILSFFGGLGFFIGGLCEVSHSCFGHHEAGLSFVAALLNCLGGLCFLLGGVAEVVSHHHIAFIHFIYLFGCLLYTAAATLIMVMWQGNDFGGTLLSQLSHAICAGEVMSIGPSPSDTTGREGLRVRLRRRLSSMSSSMSSGIWREPPKSIMTKLSLRDVVSLCIYSWLFVCTTLNFLIDVLLLPQSGGRHLANVSMTFIWMLGVKVVLVIHSTITAVPNEQPYRFAMQSMWFLLMFATAAQTFGLVSSLPIGMDSGGSSIGVDTIIESVLPAHTLTKTDEL